MGSKFLLVSCLIFSLSVSEVTHALWWSRGSRIIMDHSRLCRKKGPRFSKDPQSSICRKEPETFQTILAGSQKAMKECQYQFRNDLWNCTGNKKSLKRILMRDTPETAFLNAIVSAGVTHEVTSACSRGDLLQCSCGGSKTKPRVGKRRPHQHPRPRIPEGRSPPYTRGKNDEGRNDDDERTRRRGRGRKSKEERKQRKRTRGRRGRGQRNKWIPNTMDNSLEVIVMENQRGTERIEGRERQKVNRERAGGLEAPKVEWDWNGCDDDVDFGYGVAQDFMESHYTRRRISQDIRSIVMLWNNKAGRLAVRNHLRPHCKCHGLSGSCTHQSCWRRVPTLRSIGVHLKQKFNKAVKVTPSNDGETVIPLRRDQRPESEELLYLEDSPNFCSPNRRTGSLGTSGRVCNATSIDLPSCEILCCRKGHTTHLITMIKNCRCRFRFCCEVTCQKCSVTREVSFCQ